MFLPISFPSSGEFWWKLFLGVWLAGILERVKGGVFWGAAFLSA